MSFIIRCLRTVILLFAFCNLPFSTGAQPGFGVLVQPSSVISAPPLHSGAVANLNGKWIFIGGRIDGLHIMQSNQAFPPHGRNDSIYIVDPSNNTRLSADASQLTPSIYEAICSANMQFYQDGNYLYMIGGYGKEAMGNQWLTFHSLVSIDLNCLITNITGAGPISSCFRQLIDSNMAVAGGMLEKNDSTFYLVFGHRFDGRYARDTSVGNFTQTYTHEIRKFEIFDDGTTLSILNYRTETDTTNFHRRDLNLVPQIFPNGEYGMTAFGGVFQKNADLPFLTPIDIKASGTVHQSGFNQNLNQYTSAVMAVYDSVINEMSTVFFGGMSLYTLDTLNNLLIQDTLVPFVNTISKITRTSAGTLTEYKLSEEMPGLLGTNAYFIANDSLALLHGRIINLNSLAGLTHVGYIVGGIESDFPNIADLDPESMSRPHANVYDVYIDKLINSSNDLLITNLVNNLFIYPNPATKYFFLDFDLYKQADCSVNLYDASGKSVREILISKNLSGHQHIKIYTEDLARGLYHCEVKAGTSMKVVKVLLK